MLNIEEWSIELLGFNGLVPGLVGIRVCIQEYSKRC